MNVVDETIRGAQAFIAAATRPEVERLAAVIAHDTAFVSRLFGWKKVGKVAETCMYPLLAGAIIRSPKKAGALALAGSFVSEQQKSANPREASWLGIAGGVAQYVGYALELRHARPRKLGLAVRGALVAAGVLTRPNKAATTLVGAPMAYATELANDPALKRSTETEGLSHGANLLVASEAATALGWRLPAMSLSFIATLLLIDGLNR